ncbi:MAG TPA: adenylate/guanylate cyclase domain-containing protein, partial [Phenylobacterium sp.]
HGGNRMPPEARETIVSPPSAGAQGRRLGLALLVLAALSIICSPFFVDTLNRSAPIVHNGEVSYARWGPLDAPVALQGQWRAQWLTAPTPDARFLVKVPGPWNTSKAAGQTVPQGAAVAYFLRIKDLPAGRYLLFVPKIYAGERIWANGRLIAKNASFGLTPQTSHYMGRAAEAVIDTDGSDLDLRIDISTFQHRENGWPEPPTFGLLDPMSHWILMDWIRSLLLAASLLLLGCLAAVIFVFRPSDKVAMYLAIGSATLLPLATTMSHDNLIAIALPDLPFGALIMVQILSATAALSAALAYARALFPAEMPRLPYLIFQGLNGARLVFFAVVGLSGHIVALSEYSAMAYFFRIAALVFILGVVLMATVRRRDGAILFMIGLGAMLLSIIYTDLTSNAGMPRILNLNLLPAGMLILLFTQLIVLAERWAVAMRTEAEANAGLAQANSDLRRLLDVNISITSEMQLDVLLAKVVEVTSKVIRADRTSLFLYEPKRRELFSAVAEGLEKRQIRFPSGEGLAGWVFTHGEAVNLADAYSDARFNREIDTSTGYRTTSVLTVPVTARDGRRLGVMQALNRLDGGAFDTADLERMSAFAAQAAVAIDNATLFSDVAAERNYNDSILRSLSAGVVTLDREIKAAKLNPAAARILETPVTRLEGPDVRAWIASSNPDLLSEIDAVNKGGRPRTLLDADVRTARGETISANLSIVPLIGEKGPAGLLILIEDISEGKRMEAAMRRFMSQKVVDQVMEHDEDELLFGTACRASVLFGDIRNFTSLAETLQPRETVDMLNEVFGELVEAVNAKDGVLDKFLGDAVMAVYGAPLPTPRDPQNAVESAVTMLEMLDDLNKRRRRRGKTPLSLGVGVASGDVVAGTIGSSRQQSAMQSAASRSAH